MTPVHLEIELFGQEPHEFTDLVMDFTGTLSLDGKLLPGAAERLVNLARHLKITILSADTFGRVKAELAGLPVEVHIIQTGDEKADFVRKVGPSRVIVIGNGRNDVGMMVTAGLGIVVIGPEGAAGEVLAAADIVVRDILDALDLITNPLRAKATMRD